jgi:hypothetical protein
MHDHTNQPNVQQEYPELQEGMEVLSTDHQAIGRVIDVFRNIGDIEAFGVKGVMPQQDGFDAQQYDYSEAQPGAGDNYFVVRQDDDEVLYIAFSHIDRIDGGKVTVAADAEDIPDLNWQVRPDAMKAVAHEYEVDTGGEPQVA